MTPEQAAVELGAVVAVMRDELAERRRIVAPPAPRPHPYYTDPAYAEQRQRDEANKVFAGILGEALRRMCAEHEGKAAEHGWWAERADRYAHRPHPHAVLQDPPGAVAFWEALAARWRREARAELELAQIYRWYAHMVGPYGPPGVCTCRLPLPCTHTPPVAGGYW